MIDTVKLLILALAVLAVPSPARADGCADATACTPFAHKDLERLGLRVLDDQTTLYVGTQTKAGWQVLAPLTKGRAAKPKLREVNVSVTKRKAGKHTIAWIVTTQTSAFQIPDVEDDSMLVEAQYFEALTLCILDAKPRCPIVALPLRQGTFSENTFTGPIDDAANLKKAKASALTFAKVTLRGAKARIEPTVGKPEDRALD